MGGGPKARRAAHGQAALLLGLVLELREGKIVGGNYHGRIEDGEDAEAFRG